MNEAVEVFATACPDRHLQGVEGEVGAQGTRRLPANHIAREDVDDEGHVDPAGVGLHVGQIGHPQAIGCRCAELAVDQIRWSRGCLVGDRGADRLATDDTADPEIAHQALDGAARHPDTLAVQLRPHLVGSIHAPMLVPDARDLAIEIGVSQASR